jgi:uncharacterized protein (TIGR03086 family)
MSAIADRYRRVAAGFTARVDAVPADRWSNPSPCEGWTALDVVRHVVDVHRMMPGNVGITFAPGPDVADDPAGAWASVRDETVALLDDPARATLEYDGMFGRTAIQTTIDQFATFDVLVHTWDVARATGLDEQLDPAEVAPLLDQAKGWGDALRSPNVCGPEVAPPSGADAQTRLLCFLGRRV